MTLTSRRRAATLAAVLPLLLAPLVAGGTADAAVWHHRDARRDAVTMEFSADDGKPTFSEAPAAAEADVTRFALRHLPRKVVLTVGVRDLRKDGATSATVRLATPSGPYLAAVTRGPGIYMFMLLSMRDKDQVTCTGNASSFDTESDLVRIEIPRTCLGAPAWVRAGVLIDDGSSLEDLVVTDADDLPDSIAVTYDDALRDGGRAQLPKLSPRVRVG